MNNANPRPATRLALVPALACGCLLAGSLASAGCYRQVVSAKGLGASGVPVSQSRQEGDQGWLDRFLFGEPERQTTGSLLR